jgi:hypothetical protein
MAFLTRHLVVENGNGLEFAKSILRDTGNHLHHLLQQQRKPYFARRACLCVPYRSHNKQRLFPETALTGWAL